VIDEKGMETGSAHILILFHDLYNKQSVFECVWPEIEPKSLRSPTKARWNSQLCLLQLRSPGGKVDAKGAFNPPDIIAL
jgi:hypothetical protein